MQIKHAVISTESTMKKGTYHIGLVQAKFSNGDIKHNLEQMKKIVETTKKASPHVKLLLFPELAATGYFLSSALRQYAEGQNGKIAQYMSEIAQDQEMYISYGYIELGDNGKIYNSLALIDCHGEWIANYRKIHITSLEREIFTPGNEIVSVKTEWGHIGLMICWDLAFPELARSLALRGVELIISPSAWEKPYEEPFMRFAMARAIDNTVYVAVCNHIGPSENLVLCGKTGLYGPDGASIALAGDDDEEVIITEVDFEDRKEVQSSFFTMLKERRQDLYGF
jgi:predicted amidohydrolase